MHAETTFSLVFAGRLVAGRNAANVEKAFGSRFGEAVAQSVFGSTPRTLKRGLTRENALKFQQVLEQIGMVVQVIPSAPEVSDLSLVEQPSEVPESADSAPPLKPKGQQQEHKSQQTAEFGVLPQRPRARKAEAEPGDTYAIEEMDKAFGETLAIPPASRSYLLKLLPVAALMLLLPIIYLGITAMSAYGALWMMFSGPSWFFSLSSPGYFQLIGFAASLIASILLTLFLLRPLLARAHREPEPVRLDPQREPVLFHLVKRITAAIGAPMPHEIRVDTEANASARLAHGVFSGKLTLTIGLPLIYGASVQTVAGILAHEFGHFTQRWSMRSMYMVHQINHWFYRQIHERDNWDKFVDDLHKPDFFVLNVAAFLAQVSSYFCRLLLSALAFLASMFSFSLSREMEFDADRYEIALLGSAEYRNTAETLRILNAGHQLAAQDVYLALNNDKWVDNLPKLAELKRGKLSEKQRIEIVASIGEVNKSMFDSHPTDQARIRKAVDAEAVPHFKHSGPARGLLCDIERLSRLATLQWYRSVGVDVKPADLTPLSEFESESDNLEQASRANANYFKVLDELPQHLPLLEQSALEEKSESQLIADLSAAKSTLSESEAVFVKARLELDNCLEHQAYYRQALFWRQAGFPIDLNAYRLPLASDDIQEITRIINEFKVAEGTLRATLRTCATIQGQRLSLALELAARKESAKRGELQAVRNAYTRVAAIENSLDLLFSCNERLELLLHLLSDQPDNTQFSRQLKSEVATSEQLQRQIRETLNNISDPLAQNATLGNALPNAYTEAGPREPVAALADGGRIAQQLVRISFKLKGRMAEIALQAELAVSRRG